MRWLHAFVLGAVCGVAKVTGGAAAGTSWSTTMAITTYTAETLKNMKPEQVAALLNAAAKKQAELEAAAASRMSVKVSPKGAIMVTGLGRFPLTLYKSQWYTLREFLPKVWAFIESNPEGMSHGRGDASE